MDARGPVQRGDRQAAVVGQRREPRDGSGRLGLDFGVRRKRGAGFLGNHIGKFAEPAHRNIVGSEQVRDLGRLAGVAGGHDEVSARPAAQPC